MAMKIPKICLEFYAKKWPFLHFVDLFLVFVLSFSFFTQNSHFIDGTLFLNTILTFKNYQRLENFSSHGQLEYNHETQKL